MEQVPPSAPDHPALQRHALIVVLSAGEYEFTAHKLHVADPLVALYVPASHIVHMPPNGPVHPTLQAHITSVGLAIGESEFSGHV